MVASTQGASGLPFPLRGSQRSSNASQREAPVSRRDVLRASGAQAGRRDLPPAVDEQLREAAARVRLVLADVGAADEVLGVGIEGLLQALADRSEEHTS